VFAIVTNAAGAAGVHLEVAGAVGGREHEEGSRVAARALAPGQIEMSRMPEDDGAVGAYVIPIEDVRRKLELDWDGRGIDALRKGASGEGGAK
jgi:hypothetical protein